MTRRHPAPFEAHLNRPIDRGELEGLPAIPPPKDEEWPVIAARKHPGKPAPAWVRWTLEGLVGLSLLASLAALLQNQFFSQHDLGLLCPPGISQAVQVATKCHARMADDDLGSARPKGE